MSFYKKQFQCVGDTIYPKVGKKEMNNKSNQIEVNFQTTTTEISPLAAEKQKLLQWYERNAESNHQLTKD